MDFIHGTLILFRRDWLKQTGLFDERYFAHGNEYNLVLRAHKEGWKVVILWGQRSSILKP
jgi:GT2 family glycosyltransferase